jgi:hypothetical protein
MDVPDTSLSIRPRNMRLARTGLLSLSWCVVAMWLALSGGVAEAGDLPSEADRVFDEQGCWLLLDENKIPCTAAIIIAPGILRPDAKLNGPHGRCVDRIRTASGRIFDVPTCEENCRPGHGPAIPICTTIRSPRK